MSATSGGAPPERDVSPSPPARRPRRFVWPRWVRVAFMAALFAVFFFGSPLLALFVLPFVALVSGERAKDRATHVLHLGMKLIMRTAHVLGIVELDLPPPPREIDLGKPYVMISNHPSFIDMLVILGTFARTAASTAPRRKRRSRSGSERWPSGNTRSGRPRSSCATILVSVSVASLASPAPGPAT